ncbi:Fur family transcriptional regulator, ferric uptake regulator [Aquimarina amphilecti]|uniref:Fur family transcriptional regulator, ferric uptake regulator n=1 Tax=Aquimarina amphilecti TaxID=1038014 RepID=A0A1H7Q546_AQUAM|nr:transcriptional repressor [Aquimarina amphilecti]SEL43281.1 Fur family transcriptional regulator, ferric uptake regulator [Aquimarina amphilecti]
MKRRNTATKEAVLSVLNASGKAMSQSAIEKKINVDINRATIYRVLNNYCEDGILHRIVADDGRQYFAICLECDEDRKSLHHFHFRCEKCETISCLPEPVNFSLSNDYIVEKVNCILTGVCKDCSTS